MRGLDHFFEQIEHWARGVDKITVLVSIGGALFIMRWASYAFFYDRFGVTPEEVGFGYSQALLQSIAASTAWGAGLMVVLFAATVFVGVFGVVLVLAVRTGALVLVGAYVVYLLILSYPIQRFILRLRHIDGPRRASTASSHRRGLTDPAGLVRASPETNYLEELFSLDVPLADRVVAPIARFGRDLRRLWTHLWALRTRVPAVLATVTVASLVIVQAVCLLMAFDMGAKAEEGHTVRPQDLLGVPSLAVRAEAVTVVWSARAPSDVGGCLLYLGKADGTSVFYQPEDGDVVRAPSSDAKLSFARDHTCAK